MGILNEKVPAPTIKQQNTLPDNGGSFLPQNPIQNTAPYIVEVSLVKDVKGSSGLSSDYYVTSEFLKSCKIEFKEGKCVNKKEMIDAETILPNALEQVGYEVKRFTLSTTFQDWDKLEKNLLIGPDWVASIREMKEEELAANKNLIKSGIRSEDNEWVKFSKELQGGEWKVACRREIPGQGLKTVLVGKKKMDVIQQPVTEIQQKLPEVKIEASDFLTKPPTFW